MMSDSTVQRLRSELLQCAVCLCPMRTPRALPCLHSFCESCLHTHINIHRVQHSSSLFRMHSSQSYFPCPTCRNETKIPSDGVSMFPKDFRIINLAESLKTAEKDDRKICGICELALNDESSTAYCTDCQKTLCDSCTIQHKIKAVLRNHLILDSDIAIMSCTVKMCTSHPNDRVRFYCDTCNEGICVVCLMKKHDGHFILELDLMSQSKRLELRQCLEELQCQVWLTHDLLFKVTCGEGRLRADYEETRLKIRQHIRGLISKVTTDEGKLLLDLELKYQGSSRELGQQREKYRSHLEQIETIQNKVDGVLRSRQPEKLLDAYPNLLSQMKSLRISETSKRQLLNTEPFTSFMPGDSNLSVGCLDDTEEWSNNSRFSDQLMSDIQNEAGSPLVVKSSYSADNLLASNRSPSQSLHIKSNHSRTLYESRKEIFRCKNNINTSSNPLNKAKTIEQGTHSGHVPHIMHELLFQNNSLCPNVRLQATICGNETRLNLPYDITFAENGQLIIADSGNKRILVYDHRGHYKRTIADGKVSPRSVATIPGGNIVVADEEDKQLKVYSMTGELQKSIKLQHHSSYPYGVAVGKNGNFVVTDMITESISVISPSGETLHQFGSHGNSITSFDNPVSVTMDDCDNVFVTDSCHHCVKVFNQQGRFLYRIGTYGSGSGQLRYPKAVAIDIYGHVFIADSGNNRIVTYTRTGRYLGVILSQSQGIVHPTALATSMSGLLAVSMTDNDEVRIYEVSHLSRSMLLTVS